MYLDHYQLKRMPFEIGPDPQFLWLGEKHKEAFAILKYGILENKGFIVLIGDPGTGKSTLLNAITADFGPSIRFAKIADPALSEMDFFNYAADALEMGRTFDSKAEFLIHLQQVARDSAARSEKLVLVIDEAQRLTLELLEQIRILSNFEKPDQKAICCIFAGQSEFLDMVKQSPAMSQRVFFSHIIQPLTEAETGDYIAHRLVVAGAAGAIFNSGAVREVFRLSGGNPRLINVLCDQALLSGYAANIKTIGPNLIRECVKETLIPQVSRPETRAPAASAGSPHPAPPSGELPETSHDNTQASPGGSRSERHISKAAYWAAIAAVAALGIAGWQYFSGGFRAFSPDPPAASADARELTTTRARVSRLEAALSDQDEQKRQLEQRINYLERDAAQERNSKEKLSAELSSREALLAEMRKTLETLKNSQATLEAEIVNARDENAGLQSKVRELKAQVPPRPTAQLPPKVPAAASPPVSPPPKAETVPDPGDIIDFVIKKKSQ